MRKILSNEFFQVQKRCLYFSEVVVAAAEVVEDTSTEEEAGSISVRHLLPRLHHSPAAPGKKLSY